MIHTKEVANRKPKPKKKLITQETVDADKGRKPEDKQSLYKRLISISKVRAELESIKLL